ncbi:hypothetical protein V8C42DRAFT_323310 [Trichoderma barbatum]
MKKFAGCIVLPIGPLCCFFTSATIYTDGVRSTCTRTQLWLENEGIWGFMYVCLQLHALIYFSCRRFT